jgi:hypothetical protein
MTLTEFPDTLPPEVRHAFEHYDRALVDLDLTPKQAIARNIPLADYYARTRDGHYQREELMPLPGGYEVHCHIRETGEWDDYGMHCVTAADKQLVRNVIARRKVGDDIVVYMDPGGVAKGAITAHNSYSFWQVAIKFQNEKDFWKMMQVSANLFNESRPWKDRGLSFSGKLKSAFARLCLVVAGFGH